MPSVSSVTAADLLYLLCSVLLLGSAVLVFLRDPRSPLHRRYALTALSLLGWVATLALFYRTWDPALALPLGRANFAAAALAVSFGYLLVRSVAAQNARQVPMPSHSERLLVAEALFLALLCSFTPLIDQAEIVGAGLTGRHVTVYGVLFPLYVLHVLGYLAASALIAFRARKEETRGPVRDRLTLVGSGVLATGVVGVVADIILPYGFGDFRYTDLGPLSTALFLLAVGYAILRHRLFDLKLFVRKTLVWGLLLSFALSAYSAVLVLVTERVAGEQAGTLTRVAVLMIAFSFDPLRRYLEQRIDRYLFFREGTTALRRR